MEIAQYFEKELDYRIPDNYPFAGKDFNATSAGIHVDGLAKNEEIYNIFDTTKISTTRADHHQRQGGTRGRGLLDQPAVQPAAGTAVSRSIPPSDRSTPRS